MPNSRRVGVHCQFQLYASFLNRLIMKRIVRGLDTPSRKFFCEFANGIVKSRPVATLFTLATGKSPPPPLTVLLKVAHKGKHVRYCGSDRTPVASCESKLANWEMHKNEHVGLWRFGREVSVCCEQALSLPPSGRSRRRRSRRRPPPKPPALPASPEHLDPPPVPPEHLDPQRRLPLTPRRGLERHHRRRCLPDRRLLLIAVFFLVISSSLYSSSSSCSPKSCHCMFLSSNEISCRVIGHLAEKSLHVSRQANLMIPV